MIEYKLLKEIETNPSHTQRSLAQKLDISLGKVNYVLSGLAGKGIIKAQRLTSDTKSIRWKYLLTPKGLKEKMVITRDYLKRRLQEYSEIQEELVALKKEVDDDEQKIVLVPEFEAKK